jgi:hypothetical protein
MTIRALALRNLDNTIGRSTTGPKTLEPRFLSFVLWRRMVNGTPVDEAGVRWPDWSHQSREEANPLSIRCRLQPPEANPTQCVLTPRIPATLF